MDRRRRQVPIRCRGWCFVRNLVVIVVVIILSIRRGSRLGGGRRRGQGSHGWNWSVLHVVLVVVSGVSLVGERFFCGTFLSGKQGGKQVTRSLALVVGIQKRGRRQRLDLGWCHLLNFGRVLLIRVVVVVLVRIRVLVVLFGGGDGGALVRGGFVTCRGYCGKERGEPLRVGTPGLLRCTRQGCIHFH